ATCDSPQSCALTLKDTSGLAGVTGTMVLTTAGVPKSVAFNFTDLALTLKLDGSSLTCKSSGSGSGCLGNDECVVTTLDLVANTTCTDDGTTVSIANQTPLQVTGTTALDVTTTHTGTFSGTVTAGQTLNVTPPTGGTATTGAGTLTATFALPGASGSCVPQGSCVPL